MKSNIKDWINSGKSINQNKIYQKLKKYNYISFDFFDTLFKRNLLKPTDLFSLIEKDNKENEMFINFYAKRTRAEYLAREKTEKQEITLDDIYDYYDDNLNQSERKLLISTELIYEEQIMLPNNSIINVVKKLKEQNKKLFIISDIYLPKSFLVNILKKYQLNIFDGIFVSSEVMRTKNTGDLYQHAIKMMNIKPFELVHIGDSIKSDYIKAIQNRIKAVHIPRYEDKECFRYKNDSFNLQIINAFINNNTDYSWDNYYRFGFERFGLFLFEYVKWIQKSVIEKNLNKIYFFSRDGLIMKKAFDLYNVNPNIKTYYLEVSRRSLRVPSLYFDFSIETIIDSLPFSKIVSLEKIFENIGLDIKNYNNLMQRFNYNKNTIFERANLKQNKEFLLFLNIISDDIYQTAKNECENLLAYLKQNAVEGRFAIVDIGWSGGMHRFLDKILNKLNINHEMYGYYIGIEDNCKKNLELNPDMNMFGFLFDFKNNQNEIDKRQSFVGLLETLFLEQNGSVKNYEIENNKILAVRYPYEYIQNGVETFEYESVKKIQTGTLHFIKLASKNEIIDKLFINADESYQGLLKCGENPNKKELMLFSNFKFYDDSIEYLANPKSLFYYLLHIDTLKKDFLNCRWKIGFMKKLFKIKLPYKKIFLFLRKYK